MIDPIDFLQLLMLTISPTPLIPANLTEAFSVSCKTSEMEHFAKLINGWKPLIIFTKRSILVVWQSSEYVFVKNLLRAKIIPETWNLTSRLHTLTNLVR